MSHYMTRRERDQLEALTRAGLSVAAIARQMGFCRQTIYNELRRGEYLHTVDYRDVKRYSAQKAQQVTTYNQTAKGRELKIGSNHALADFLERKILREHFSPEAALAEARKAGFTDLICRNTLYSYIDKKIFAKLRNKHLPIKGNRKPKAEKPESRTVHQDLPQITLRPEWVNLRLKYGHWEMDLIVSCRGGRSALLTLTERMTRELLIFKIPNKKASSVRAVFDKLEKDPGFREKFKTITTDNGPEFLEYEDLINSIYGGKRFDIYYCHSYSAWEKGSVENNNRMIRRFFPKGTNFDKVSEQEIRQVQNWINNYPRKILGWKSALEAAA